MEVYGAIAVILGIVIVVALVLHSRKDSRKTPTSGAVVYEGDRPEKSADRDLR
jgi:hypothetical protein